MTGEKLFLAPSLTGLWVGEFAETIRRQPWENRAFSRSAPDRVGKTLWPHHHPPPQEAACSS